MTITTESIASGNEDPGLVRLSESPHILAHPDEDVRDRTVRDSQGNDFGTVKDLIIDQAGQKVRFLHVGQGGVLGIGQRTVLIPVDAIVRITAEDVHINQDQDRVHGAPAYDPELTEARYYESVYGYYGLGPFWAAGYTYPPFPHYP
ncbi:PRC-barrel domain-containing protein [Arthrobacter sp. Soc17.1.1.1]|uniref:PRC-barrel domain-containing protein n=1 Tax=Arthrobacter sp. Soc17.1.1.1 TaxID=3121277 RepID=UPI002FE4CA24